MNDINAKASEKTIAQAIGVHKQFDYVMNMQNMYAYYDNMCRQAQLIKLMRQCMVW